MYRNCPHELVNTENVKAVVIRRMVNDCLLLVGSESVLAVVALLQSPYVLDKLVV